MKISRIRSQILVLPQEDPLANTTEDPNAARPMVIVRLDTDDGIEGIGVTFYGGAITASLKRAVDDLVERQVAPERAARIGRDALTCPAEQFPPRLAERLAADVPQRNVDRRQRQGEHSGRPGAPGRGAQLGDDRLDPQGVLADRQRPEIVDRALQ